MSHLRNVPSVVSLFLAGWSLCYPQQTSPAARTRPDRGLYPTGSFSVTDFDTINDSTGNLYLTVPIAALPPGRGGSQFAVNLIYNSALYDTVQSVSNRDVMGGGTKNVIEYTLQGSQHGGWRYSYQFGLEHEVRAAPEGAACGGTDASVWRVHKMYLRTPDGALHTLRLYGRADYYGDAFYPIGPDKESHPCTPANERAGSGTEDLVYYTDDSSFIRVHVSFQDTLSGCLIQPSHANYWTCRLWRAFLPDGTEIQGYGAMGRKIVDRNGNAIHISEYMSGANKVTLVADDLGRSVEVEHELSSGAPIRDIVRTEAVGRPAERLEWTVSVRRNPRRLRRVMQSSEPE